MKDTLRTFIAIKIKPEKNLSDLFNVFKKSLKGEEIRWVDIDNLHLTLRFLGETNKEQIDEIGKLLETISENFQPFIIGLKGVGYFKSKKQPRVLFLNVENDFILRELAGKIEDKLNELNFGEKGKIFTPHVTIGRFKFITDKIFFYSQVKRFVDTKIQQVTVSEIIFYQSILSSEGPTYLPIKIVTLN